MSLHKICYQILLENLNTGGGKSPRSVSRLYQVGCTSLRGAFTWRTFALVTPLPQNGTEMDPKDPIDLADVARQLADSPINKAARQLAGSPVMTATQKLFDSPAFRLIEQFERSPVMQVARMMDRFDQLYTRPLAKFDFPKLPSLDTAFPGLGGITTATQALARHVDEQTRFMGTATQALARHVDEQTKFMGALAKDLYPSKLVTEAIAGITQPFEHLNAITRALQPPAFLRVGHLVEEAVSATARLALKSPLLSAMEHWWETLERARRTARRSAPRPWREVYAAQDGLEANDARKVEELTLHVLGLSREYVSYVYEAILDDGWERSNDPVGYLKAAARRRRERDEARGSRVWLENEREGTWLDLVPSGDVSTLASSPFDFDPCRLDALRALTALLQMKLKPEAVEFLEARSMGMTEGDLLRRGWDRTTLERAKKQVQRAIAGLRGQWLQ
jgi:hypothetical protein